MIKFGEFAPDVADYNLEVATVADNVIAGANGYRPITTPSIRTGVTAGTYYDKKIGAHNRTPPGSPSLNYRIIAISTAGNLAEFYAGGNAFHQASINLSTGQGHFEFVDWDDDVIIFADSMNPQIISDAGLATGGSTKTANLGGSPPQAKVAARVGSQLVLGSTRESSVDYPGRVWWSAFADPTGWTAGDNQAGYHDLENGGEVTRIVGDDEGLVFQATAITRMRYTGIPAVWEFDTVEKNIGTWMGRSVVRVGGDVYFRADDGFRVLMEGAGASQLIGAEKVEEWFRANSHGNSGDLHKMWGAYDFRTRSVWWTFLDASTAEQVENDRMIIYNIPTKRWSTATIDAAMILQDRPVSQASNSLVSAKSTIHLVKKNAGTVTMYRVDGATDLAATIETGHVFDENRKTEVKGVRPIIDGDCTITVLTKAENLDDSETSSGAVTPNANGVADFRAEGRYHRIRCTTTSDFTQATGLVVDQSPAGER